MLALLLVYIIKGNRRINSVYSKNEVIRKLVNKVKYIVTFFFFLLLTSSAPINDNIKTEKLSFKIIKKNRCLGFINVEKASLNETTTYTIASEVKAKVVFNFLAEGMEKSVFKSDTLIYSSMFRKINGNEKLNHSISLKNGKYFLKDIAKGKNGTIDLEVIYGNLATLFFTEPINIQKIYSDRYKRNVKIFTLGNNTYKVKLPNKSVSIYHYREGKCVLIEIQGPFYKVKLITTT